MAAAVGGGGASGEWRDVSALLAAASGEMTLGEMVHTVTFKRVPLASHLAPPQPARLPSPTLVPCTPRVHRHPARDARAHRVVAACRTRCWPSR